MMINIIVCRRASMMHGAQASHGMKIRKGDHVKIVSGNDHGKEGKVLSVLPVLGKIVIEGVNMKKKHVRPREQGKKGELVVMPAPFPASRAMLICPTCSKPTRIGGKVVGQKKYRICKKCGAEV